MTCHRCGEAPISRDTLCADCDRWARSVIECRRCRYLRAVATEMGREGFCHACWAQMLESACAQWAAGVWRLMIDHPDLSGIIKH